MRIKDYEKKIEDIKNLVKRITERLRNEKHNSER